MSFHRSEARFRLSSVSSVVTAPTIFRRNRINSGLGASRSAPLSDYIEWDVRNWSATIDFWRGHSTRSLAGASALEIGSRHGGLSLWLATQGAKVVCSDLNGPSERAVQQHRKRGVSDLIEYRSIDATAMHYQEEFDIVLFKSVLGGIGGHGGRELQRTAIKEMHRALKKDGELFFAENLVASPAHQFFRRKFITWSAKWRYVSVAEMEEFLSPFSQVEFFTSGFAGAFGRNETQRNWLGRFDKILFDHLAPNSWKYIIAGVAKK